MKRKAGDVTFHLSKPKPKRKALNVPGTIVTKIGGTTRTFVPRSVGTPLAITERKYFDSTRTVLALADGSIAAVASAEMDPATLNCLFAPTQGDDFNNRQGRKLQVLGLKIRATINVAAQVNQTTADVAPTVRIMLIQDKQTNTAQLNSEDVILTSGVYGSLNPAFFGRFRVLRDKWFNLPYPPMSFDATNIEQSGYQRKLKLKIKFRKPVMVHYNSTNGGTVADIVDNSFHVLGWTTDTTLAPSIAYMCRTTFVDV